MDQQYAVILTFPKEISNELSILRYKFNKSVYEIVPHVTLKMPFELLISIEDFRKILNEIALNTKPFDIETNGLGYFENSINGVIYVAIKDIDRIKNLHKKIVLKLKDFIKDIEEPKFELDNYVPHATIGESIPKEELEKCKQELLDYNPKYKIKIDSFSLFLSKDNHKWDLISTFKLS